MNSLFLNGIAVGAAIFQKAVYNGFRTVIVTAEKICPDQVPTILVLLYRPVIHIDDHSFPITHGDGTVQAFRPVRYCYIFHILNNFPEVTLFLRVSQISLTAF